MSLNFRFENKATESTLSNSSRLLNGETAFTKLLLLPGGRNILTE